MQSGDCEAAKLGKYDLADIGLAQERSALSRSRNGVFGGRKRTGGFEVADFQSRHFYEFEVNIRTIDESTLSTGC